jgi:DNA polymerase-1
MTTDYIDLCDYPSDQLKASHDNPELLKEPIALDTETVGPFQHAVPFYFSWSAHDLGSGAGPTTTKDGIDFLTALCCSPRPKVFHNIKFDWNALENIGLQVHGAMHDTLLAHALLQEHDRKHNLKRLAKIYLGDEREEAAWIRKIFNDPKQANNSIPQKELHPYAVLDAENTLNLMFKFAPRLHQEGVWESYRRCVDAELAYRDIDKVGIEVDKAGCLAAQKAIEPAIQELKTKLDEQIAPGFNPYSTKDMNKHVPTFGLPLKEKTPAGNWKLDKVVLQGFTYDHRIQLILAYKGLTRARQTLDKYVRLAGDGTRLYPEYKQVTVTGRSSCSGIPLQQIPKPRAKMSVEEVGDEKLAKLCSGAFEQVRRGFIPRPGFVLIGKDYSQVEYRVAAHETGSPRLIDALNAGEDFHVITSNIVFGRYDKKLRFVIKRINYGLLYGMSEFLLLKLVVPYVDDGKEVLSRYNRQLPEMIELKHRLMQEGETIGYVRSALGRKFRMPPRSRAYYLMVAYLCQGTAAEIKKEALIRCNNILQGRKTNIVADIHDELVFEFHPDDIDLLDDLHAAMEDFPQLSVPLEVDTSVGLNLLDVEEYKELDAAKEAIISLAKERSQQ